MKRTEHILIKGEKLKQCCHCKQFKLLSDFYTDRRAFDGLRDNCKVCGREYYNNYRKTHYERVNGSGSLAREKLRKNRAKFIANMKKEGCKVCGYNRCIEALEFHHINGNKNRIISRLRDVSKEKIKKEADKCIVLCANCHREIHHNNKEATIENRGVNTM